MRVWPLKNCITKTTLVMCMSMLTLLLVLYPCKSTRADKIDEWQFESLICELRCSYDSEIRRGAAENLGRRGDRRATKLLIETLKRDKVYPVCVAAAQALGSLRDENAVNPLITALKNSNSEIRTAAAKSLGNFHYERVADALVKLLSDEEKEVQFQAAYSLAQMGDGRGVPTLLGALRKADMNRSRAIRKTLTDLDRLSVVPLISALRDSSIQWEVIRILADIGDRRATIPIAELLRDKNGRNRDDAATALGKLRDPLSVTDLVNVLMVKDELSEVRKQAAWGLGEIGDSHAIDQLMSILTEPSENSELRVQVAQSLGKIGDRRAITALARALNETDWNVQLATAISLATFNDDRSVHQLITILSEQHKDRDRGSEPRAQAALSLGKIGDRRAIKALVHALKDSSQYVQLAAAVSLASFGDHRGVPLLIEVSTSGKWRYEDYKIATEALAGLGQEEGIEELIKILSDDNELKGNWAHNVLVGASASAVEPLITVLQNGSVTARVSAASTLRDLDWKPHTKVESAYFLVGLSRFVDAAKLGEPAIEPLIFMFRHGDEDKQKSSAEAIEMIGEEVVDSLLQLLEDQNLMLKHTHLVKILGNIGGQKATSRLLLALKEPDDWRAYSIGSAAAESLGVIRDKRAVLPLIDSLKGKNVYLRAEAAFSLGLLGDTRAVSPLMSLLKNEDEDNMVRCAAADALGELGDERAVVPLKNVLHKHDELRIYAVRSLCRLSKKQELQPEVSKLQDWYIGPEVAYILENADWEPSTDEERIHYWIAMRLKQNVIAEWETARQVLVSDIHKKTDIESTLYAFLSIGKDDDVLVSELIRALNAQDKFELANSYLNCAHDKLREAAIDWARRHGATIRYRVEQSEKVGWGDM